MKNIKILDCTVRDGGYLNDWNFGHNNLVNIFEHVTSAGIDYMELGFLDDRQPFDINRSIMPNTDSMNKIYGGLDKKNTILVGMIDYGTCDIKNIQPKSECILDGIRVIFKKHLRHKAMDFCRQLKDLGYLVFSQAVSITSYEDEELLDLIKLANEVQPYALSIVDTYGLLHKNQLFHFYNLINDNLDQKIGIGYHAHNNFQLGYANCIELMHLHGENPRLLLCDGSVFGMGKGAGNAPTELLAMYLNENYDAHYDISYLLEIIDTLILNLYNQARWGYQLKYFIAASNDCHPNYVTFLLDKKTLSVKSINEILSRIDLEKKLMYDRNHIEQLYIDYQKYNLDDSKDLSELSALLSDKELLILGPGKSIIEESHKIKDYINEKAPLVIAINFIPEDINIDFVFFSNAKRYSQQIAQLSRHPEIKTIATSNVTKGAGNFDFVFDYSKLIDTEAEIPDNSLIMLLCLLRNVNCNNIVLAGFDGYTDDNSKNYYMTKMEYDFIKQIWNNLNIYMSDKLSDFSKSLSIKSLTSTLYPV